MLNKYFSSVFSATSGGDNIDINDININDLTNNVLVDNQDATTEPNGNNNDINNGNVNNNSNENSHVLDRQNCVQENVFNSSHTHQMS